MGHGSLMMVCGGVAFFMYGMSLAAESLQKLAANRIRHLLSKVAGKGYLAVGVGILMTIFLQSSGAVTSMLVGLGSAGVIRLSEVMGIIIGSAVGSTVTVQLISFNVAQFGLPIFVICYTIYFVTKRRRIRYVLSTLMGFGLIFFGLELISSGAKVFAEFDLFVRAFSYLNQYPFATFMVATIFSAFAHSSAITVGIAMGLASAKVIDLHDAMFWVYGANVGTTSTALLASLGGNFIGRQVAWAHFFYRILSVALFALFTDPFVAWIQGSVVARDIANAHTIYNIFAAVIFYPFINIGSRLMEKVIPRPESEREFGVKFIDRVTYQSPAIALSYAKRELLRMGDILIEMLKDSISLFAVDDPDLVDRVRKDDNKVDLLNREINLFLLEYANENNQGVDQRVIEMISFGSDLESAADVIDNSILDLAGKMHSLKLKFSGVGWKEIQELHAQVVKVAELSLSCFQLEDRALAEQVVDLKRQIRIAERQMRESHIDRLAQGLKESINTSSIHLDILGDYRRVVSLLANHAYKYVKNGG